MSMVLLILAGLVVASAVLAGRLVRGDVDRSQAEFAAESCLEAALLELDRDPTWLPEARQPDDAIREGPCAVWGGVHGVWVWLGVEATHRRRRARLQSLVGGTAGPAYDTALAVSDTTRPLFLTRAATVRGLISTGTRDVVVQGIGPSGEGHDGQVVVRRGEPAFAVDARVVRRGVADVAERLGVAEDGGIVLGRGAFDPPPSGRAELGATVAFRGDVTVRGPVDVPDGTLIVAGGRLVVEGDVRGRDLVMYGSGGVTVRGGRFSGQVIGAGPVQIDEARLLFPSVVVALDGEAARGSVTLGLDAVVDGVVLILRESTPAWEGVQSAPTVDVGEGSLVRGAVVSERLVRVQGEVRGSVLAEATFIDEVPSPLLNWLDAGTIDRRLRPSPFLVPLGVESARSVSLWSRPTPVGGRSG